MNKEFADTITKDEVNQLPLRQFEGKIFVISSLTDMQIAVGQLEKEEILGFDTETRPSFKKNKKYKVALLQLATKENAYLFRLKKIGLPKDLVRLVNNKNILKVGAALKDDIRALQSLGPIEPEGFVDLQEYSSNFGITVNALKSLTAIVLGFRISKSQQTSNWENEVLTEAQKTYAATDAWVCLEIYNKLNHMQ